MASQHWLSIAIQFYAASYFSVPRNSSHYKSRMVPKVVGHDPPLGTYTGPFPLNGDSGAFLLTWWGGGSMLASCRPPRGWDLRPEHISVFCVKRCLQRFWGKKKCFFFKRNREFLVLSPHLSNSLHKYGMYGTKNYSFARDLSVGSYIPLVLEGIRVVFF